MCRRPLKNEQGSVLIIVLGVLVLIAIIAVGLLRITGAQTKIIQHVTGSDESLYTAEKISNEYLWQFNNDQNFDFLGDSSKYVRNVDSVNHKVVYRPLLSSYNPEATYRVEIVVPQQENASGVWQESTKRAVVRVTSWEPIPDKPNDHSLAKTIEVEMVKRNFTQFGWITDSERDEEDEPVYWRENDKFYGPLHTNGSLYLYYTIVGTKPAFYGPVTYVDSIVQSPLGLDAASNSKIFRKGVAKVEKIGWPVSNTYLISMAEAPEGHYYHGRTCIYLDGDQYVVRNWDSQTHRWNYNGLAYEFDAASNDDIYNDRGIYYYPQKIGYTWKYPASGTATFQEFRHKLATDPPPGLYIPMSIPIPENGVIYVDGTECDESDYHGDTSKFDRELGNVFVSGTLKGQLTIGAKNDIFITSYDPTDWRNPWLKPGGLLPVVRNSFAGFTATDGLQYSSTSFEHVNDSDGNWDHEDVIPEDGSDILGLAAQQNIRILHRSWPAPVETNAAGLIDHVNNWGWLDISGIDYEPLDVHAANDATGNHKDISIQAAMFCNTGSFGFEDPHRGLARGTMYVVGSVAQRLVHNPGDFDWTATVNLDGYKRNITHDPRMTYMSPPYFIEPTQAGFQTVGWSESHVEVVVP